MISPLSLLRRKTNWLLPKWAPAEELEHLGVSITQKRDTHHSPIMLSHVACKMGGLMRGCGPLRPPPTQSGKALLLGSGRGADWSGYVLSPYPFAISWSAEMFCLSYLCSRTKNTVLVKTEAEGEEKREGGKIHFFNSKERKRGCPWKKITGRCVR